jgi:opacity protein-like surface antigen
MGTRTALAAATLAALFAAADAAAQGFYLKVMAGYSDATSADFTDDDPTSPDCFLKVTSTNCVGGQLNSLGSSFVGGIGAGILLPHGFRIDLTYQNRSGYNLSGTDPAGTTFDPQLTSNSLMVSGFYTLPVSLGPVKPYIGVGIGASRNKLDNINWNDPTCCSGTLPGGSTTQFAWQLTLGAEWEFAKNWILEFYYSYADMGKFVKAQGSDVSGAQFNASGTTDAATGKLRANELIFALRYDFK